MMQKELASKKKEYKRLVKKMDEKYEAIAGDFKESFKEFITEEFWRKYLCLSDS